MLLIEEALIQQMLATPAIATATDRRISTAAEQNTPLPYIVVRTYVSVPVETHGGVTNQARSGVQVEVYHKAGSPARHLAELCRRSVKKAFEANPPKTRSIQGLDVGYAEMNFASPDEPRQRPGDKVIEHQALLDCVFLHEIEAP